MNVCLFLADSVLYFLDGKPCRKSWDDFKEDISLCEFPIRVLVTGVRFDQHEDEPREAVVSSKNEDGKRVFMRDIYHGRLAGRMSASAERIKDIFSFFPPGRISSCVPYALMAREYIFSDQDSSFKGVSIVLEEILDFVFLIVFDEFSIVEMRELPVIPEESMLEEIRRSAKRFSGERNIRVMSKNERILERIHESGWDVEKLNVDLCGFSGESFVRTADGFLPFEERERRSLFHRRFRAVFLIAGLLVVCIAGASWGFWQRGMLKVRLEENQRLSSEIAVLESEIRKLSSETYIERIRAQGFLDIGTVFYHFLFNMPSEWEISSFGWQGDWAGKGVFTADIFDKGRGVFRSEGIFTGSKTARLFISGLSAVRITANIDGDPK